MFSNLLSRRAPSVRKSSSPVEASRQKAAARRSLFLERLEPRWVLATTLGIEATNANRPEGNSGTTEFTFTVTRSDDLTGTTSVDFTVTGSGTNQASGADFLGGALPSSTVNFAVGESTQTITLRVVGDVEPEQDEEFTVTLSNPSSPATITTATATGTIQNDDGAVPTATFDITPATADRLEGNSGTTPFTFTVTRTGDTTTAASVDYATTGRGTSQATGADFSGGALPATTLNFAAGVASRTLTLFVVGDVEAESDEGFTVTLSNPSGANTIGTATAPGTIQNDDGTPPGTSLAIAAADANKLEGNSGTTAFTFTVTRTGDTSGATTATFAVTGSGTNAAAASDFQGGAFPTGNVNFAAGETTQTVTVNVIGDVVTEEDEGFTVTLADPSAPATIATATAPGTIQNDDGTGGATTLAIAATDAVKAEGNVGTTPFTFTVTRGGSTSGTTSVQYAVTGSGTNPATGPDFFGGALPTDTINFSDGQTTQIITIDVIGDSLGEPDEGFTVTLSNPSAPATITTDDAIGTIINDDGGGGGGTTLAIAAADASKLEGNAGTTPFTFTVTRSGDTSGATSVNYAVTGSGGSPAAATDFSGGALPTGEVNFAAGQTSQTITIDVIGDTTAEPDEGFTVTLSNPSGPATITTDDALGTIQNDDGAVGTSLDLAATDASKLEGNSGITAFTFTVTRSGDTSGATSVEFAVSGSGINPAAGSDFQTGSFPTGTVNFAAGQTSQIVTVNVTGDTTAEPDEGFTLTLSNPSTPATINTNTALGTILNDDGAAGGTTLAIVAADASKLEGNSGTTAFTFTVTRSGNTTGATTVNFAVAGSGGSPAAGSDFLGGSFPVGTVNFAAGQTSQTVTVNVLGDVVVESDEGFSVTLSNPSAPATITTASALGSILNDDGTGTGTTLAIVAADASKLEGNSGTTAFTFTVTRSGNTTGATSVNFAVAGSGGSPAAGSDFSGGSFPIGTVNFAAGQTSQTVTVSVLGDVVVESDEGFTVTLSNPSAPATITTASALGSILNDDGTGTGTTLAIAATDASNLEGDVGTTPFTFTVTRSGNTTGATSVNFAVTGSGGAAGSDFAGGSLPSGTVNFAAGQTSQTITVNVAGDTAIESDEGFTVTLSNPSAPATITVGTAAGTILNDDEEVEEPVGVEIETENSPGAAGSASVEDDADNPGEGALIVTGTSKSDVIVIQPRPGNRSQIRVLRNGRVIGNFNSSEVDNIVVFGLAGNDTIIVDARLSQSATLFGDSGNDALFGARGDDQLDGGSGNDRLFGLGGSDHLVGGSGNDKAFGGQGNDRLFGQSGNDLLFGESGDDIVVGGDGNDKLFGGSGRDLLIGGLGADFLYGESHDDVLVSGSTAFDEDPAALDAILAEMTSSNSYNDRVSNIRDGGGANGDATLNDSTVDEDGAVDTLFGQGGQDWFFFGSRDKVRDRSGSEQRN